MHHSTAENFPQGKERVGMSRWDRKIRMDNIKATSTLQSGKSKMPCTASCCPCRQIDKSCLERRAWVPSCHFWGNDYREDKASERTNHQPGNSCLWDIESLMLGPFVNNMCPMGKVNKRLR